MRYLLDTNVLSELRKASVHHAVRTWISSVRGDDLFLSVLVIGEIRRGIESVRRRDLPQALALEAWVGKLQQEYGDRTLAVTSEIAEEWGRMSVPNPIPVIDGLMAATARVHNLTFVTRNGKDVASTGVRILDPFACG